MLGEILSFAFLVQDINYLHIYTITTNGKKGPEFERVYVKTEEGKGREKCN